MTARRSKPSKDNPGSHCWHLDPLYDGHPARSRICNAWEVMAIALDELPIVDQVLVLTEIHRRIDEKAVEKLRILHEQSAHKKDPPHK